MAYKIYGVGFTKIMKATIAIIIGSLTLVMTVAIFLRLLTLMPKDNELEKCQSYERAGVLDQGSCKCVEKLFPNDWGSSYDWKDACAIIEAHKTIANDDTKQ